MNAEPQTIQRPAQIASARHRIERLPNGLIRVFDRASQLVACYHADGAYAHGDLRAATLRALLGTEQPE